LAQARLAGLVGWALVEDGIPTLARDWFHIAASVAREHGDRETRMWAVTLGAFAALAVADWPSADGFAGAALMVAASPSPVTVMAYHAQAEARARLGQPTEALRALQAAELEAVHMDQGHGWYQVTYPWALYWAQRGQILRRLDMTDKAQEALSTGLGAVAPQAHRLRAHLQLDLIACQTIDPDERAEHVRNALAAVPEDQWSARLRDHVGEVRVLMPRPRIPDDDRQEDDEDDGAKKGEVGGVGLSTCC
jgi:tetratricopeptide (TPR) repeat protein